MDYIKIRFGNDFDYLESGFEKSFDEMFQAITPMFRFVERIWKPQMDIYETSEDIYILAEIAGVNKDNLEVEVSTKAVKIYGDRPPKPCMENIKYRLAEIQYGKFERILYLPAPIDTEKVSASCLDGFLKIRLAKLQLDRGTHKISVSDG